MDYTVVAQQNHREFPMNWSFGSPLGCSIFCWADRESKRSLIRWRMMNQWIDLLDSHLPHLLKAFLWWVVVAWELIKRGLRPLGRLHEWRWRHAQHVKNNDKSSSCRAWCSQRNCPLQFCSTLNSLRVLNNHCDFLQSLIIMCEESLKLVQSHACDEEPLQESNPVLSLVLGDFVGFVLGIFGITQFLCEFSRIYDV